MFKVNIISQIIRYIESQNERQIKIEDITCHSGYSRRYVQILFKELMGIPIGQYLRNRRIMRAATLLRLTNTPIIQISYLLHFDSQQTFTREFKKITGYTPLFYRRAKTWFLDVYRVPELPEFYPPMKPVLCSLLGGIIAGYKICYDEPIPCPRIMGDYRWDNIVRFKQRKQQNIWLLTDFSPSDRTFHAMSVNTTIGTLSDKSNIDAIAQYEYPHGLYAVFSFSGTRDEYHQRIKDIYYKFLPFWGYNRRAGPDVECFYSIDSADNGIIRCDTYIPVQSNDNYNS
ncbi:helix-turn-helix domain-containing protein [Citrobacter cronae]|uniref:helix-turn-helix domain-containing protein n=1 Tax=Citrobacter cronae TaxID=1748967 RepID=UPI0021CDEF91|nr:helix-turn-helix domain-containing protein [Citrobacter cronae]MCU6198646.1 helix-turn-helix domain-containing protein [Citrobacter cronae]